MKTTVKLTADSCLVVLPVGEGVRLDVTVNGLVMAREVLTLDQVGALLFGIEQASEAAERERMLNAAMSKARAPA